jgi:hypothetical protein
MNCLEFKKDYLQFVTESEKVQIIDEQLFFHEKDKGAAADVITQCRETPTKTSSNLYGIIQWTNLQISNTYCMLFR